MNPNIVALQAAEKLLRDHDARIGEAKAELKRLHAERKDLSDRVQQCIDVLCGRVTPSLFTAVDEGEHRADGAAEYQAAQRAATELALHDAHCCATHGCKYGDDDCPVRIGKAKGISTDECERCQSAIAEMRAGGSGPLVCGPVGAGRLADIPGLTKHDIACLSAVGLNTLADLERECDGDLSKVAESLSAWAGAFTSGEADRIQRAVESHLRPATVPAEPTGVRYPGKDDWRNQGLALLGLNEKLLKACKKQKVFTVGELHDWIDEETRERGGFFGPGVLAGELERVGKIATKWAKANAEILYQFCADRGFAGVPEKEAV